MNLLTMQFIKLLATPSLLCPSILLSTFLKFHIKDFELWWTNIIIHFHGIRGRSIFLYVHILVSASVV
jgi:hypothetical protein